jgi:hypothetical protein
MNAIFPGGLKVKGQVLDLGRFSWVAYLRARPEWIWESSANELGVYNITI